MTSCRAAPPLRFAALPRHTATGERSHRGSTKDLLHHVVITDSLSSAACFRPGPPARAPRLANRAAVSAA
eukprot:344637-Heterocapsa_arctica.AAC.1